MRGERGTRLPAAGARQLDRAIRPGATDGLPLVEPPSERSSTSRLYQSTPTSKYVKPSLQHAVTLNVGAPLPDDDERVGLKHSRLRLICRQRRRQALDQVLLLALGQAADQQLLERPRRRPG